MLFTWQFILQSLGLIVTREASPVARQIIFNRAFSLSQLNLIMRARPQDAREKEIDVYTG